MDEPTFRAYLSEFNGANYDALVRYYADDVTFSFADGTTLRGRDAIVAFYRPLHECVKESAEVVFLVMDAQGRRRRAVHQPPHPPHPPHPLSRSAKRVRRQASLPAARTRYPPAPPRRALVVLTCQRSPGPPGRESVCATG
ncbi:nuclear transport factor 2 family protein [Trebonia sp.]|uniref:nuclear transport factor 2 family protein n=1 Tax=Trebonia sp. TaxID=2767075 RepID=UPI00260CEE67|nr:nuclear transport factor 2 family protein [Trebonia sp.]